MTTNQIYASLSFSNGMVYEYANAPCLSVLAVQIGRIVRRVKVRPDSIHLQSNLLTTAAQKHLFYSILRSVWPHEDYSDEKAPALSCVSSIILNRIWRDRSAYTPSPAIQELIAHAERMGFLVTKDQGLQGLSAMATICIQSKTDHIFLIECASGWTVHRYGEDASGTYYSDREITNLVIGGLGSTMR